MVNWELAVAEMLCPALGRLQSSVAFRPLCLTDCQSLTVLAWLGVPSRLSARLPRDSSRVGLLHSLLCPAWSGAAGILLRLMGFSLLTSAGFLPLEICHTAEMGSHGAFSCLDSEVEFRYYTLPPSFHSQAA